MQCLGHGGSRSFGVRPSSGAAVSKNPGSSVKSHAFVCLDVAAPEDGRTPPPVNPAFTEGLLKKSRRFIGRATFSWLQLFWPRRARHVVSSLWGASWIRE